MIRKMILYRYLTREFLVQFFISLFGFLALYLFVDMMTRLWKIKHPMLAFLEFYFFSIPQFVFYLVPVSVMLATLTLYGNLIKSGELSVLYTGGVRKIHVFLPGLIPTLLICGGLVVWVNTVIPAAKERGELVKIVKMLKLPESAMYKRNKQIWAKEKNLIYYIQNFDKVTRQAHYMEVFIYNEEGVLTQRIQAESAIYKENQVWDLYKVVESVYYPEKQRLIVQNYKQKSMMLMGTPKEFFKYSIDPKNLSLVELYHYINKNKLIGLRTSHYETAFHGNLAFAFTPIVMFFIATLFSLNPNRARTFAKDIGICLVICLFYWFLYSFFQSLGKNEAIPASLSAWIPNLLFFILFGVTMWVRRK